MKRDFQKLLIELRDNFGPARYRTPGGSASFRAEQLRPGFNRGIYQFVIP
jgi:hypothetical protein